VARPPDFRSTHRYTFRICSFWRERYIFCSLQLVWKPKLSWNALNCASLDFSDYSTALAGETFIFPNQTQLTRPNRIKLTNYPELCTYPTLLFSRTSVPIQPIQKPYSPELFVHSSKFVPFILSFSQSIGLPFDPLSRREATSYVKAFSSTLYKGPPASSGGFWYIFGDVLSSCLFFT